MLRRVVQVTSSSPMVPLYGAGSRMALQQLSPRGALSVPAFMGPSSSLAAAVRCASSPPSNDDKAELERERQLRERFESLKKANSGGFFSAMRQQMEEMRRQQELIRQQRQGGGTGTNGTTGGGSQQAAPPGGVALQMMYSVLLYTTAFYAVLLVYQSSQPESVISTMAGQPWWAAQKETVAVALLSRIVHSLSTQRELRTALEAHNKMAPTDSIDLYVLRFRPDLLAGHTTSAFEVVDVVSRALNGAGTACATTITSAARTTRDQRAAFDAIVAALRRDYPMYCPPNPYAPMR